jgi:hypothetical protein
MSPFVSIAADGLVAVLLAATIVTSVRLSRRITWLKADEAALRQTIGELVQASETAERAIAGLRTTLSECDRTLADRLRTAERYAADLAEQVAAGNQVMARIAQIVESSRPAAAGRPDPEPQPQVQQGAHGERLSAAAAAAQALADRAAKRLAAAA